MGQGIGQQRSEAGPDLGRDLLVIAQHRSQRWAAHELGHEKTLLVLGIGDVENLHDTGVTELGDRAGFGDEPRCDFLVLAQVRVDHLHRHLAPQPEIARAVDRRHPAVADLAEQLVLDQLGRRAHR